MYYEKLDHFYNKRFKYRKVYLQKYLIVENNQGSMIFDTFEYADLCMLWHASHGNISV